ncbi:uncharacterized protein LOC106071694 [Biomphalaria glabrata]|uniref:Uncharacterized protein LOC106071694 n=1 Tax=Biomphalaria glabrata TaxID=6526 RepID=A0A9U8EH10_BIOGL|nr:uncharacterized protein LOC106071694 [Biomphalaria glabrata]KAI8772207.1 hypothetical protein BgiBS90_026687 [Biomphalaria glabrata]
MSSATSATYLSFVVLLVVMTIHSVISVNTTRSSHGDKLRCLNESSWSTQECRNAVTITYRDEQRVTDKCRSLGMLNVSLEQSSCTDSDVRELINFLCQDNWTDVDCLSHETSLNASTTSATAAFIALINSTEEERRTLALDIIDKELSEKCQDFMWPHAVNFTGSLELACSLLENASVINESFCLQPDMDKLYAVICYEDPKDPKVIQLVKKLSDALNRTSDLCRADVFIAMAKTTNETEPCQWWEQLKSERLGNQYYVCTQDELNLVSRAMCPQHYTTHRFAPITTLPARRIINETLREKILSFVDHDISSNCRWSVGLRISRQITDLRRVCKMFQQSGSTLINNQICSTDEVMKLTGVFCRLDFHAGLRKVADTEEGRRAQAMDIMANELSPKCHNIMWPQVVIFEGSLSMGCNLLATAASTLVSAGFCLQSDIDKLQPIVCYIQPKDPKLVQFEDNLSQVLDKTSDSCNTTVHLEMVNATSEIEACELMRNLKTELLKDNKCTDSDVKLFISTMCSGQWIPSISIIVLMLCILLSSINYLNPSST